MIPRRNLIGLPAAGAMMGLLGSSDVDAAPAAQQQLTDRSLDGNVRAIESVRDEARGLRDEMRNEQSFAEIRRIRDAQKEYLRVNLKWPDFIEVGVDVWLSIHDWHIKWQQPLALGRDAGGRYTLVHLSTVLILRADLQPGFIGLPFDNPR